MRLKIDKKYLQTFKTSMAQEFTYKVNFIMWRVRNMIQIIVAFFLWDAAYSSGKESLFGYSKDQMITYVFGLILVRALVLSTKSREVAGEISRGDLNNYLVKPLNYFKYWMTRDVASKVLNLFFALGEMIILYLLFRPPFFLQLNPLYVSGFVLAIIVSILIYFLLIFLVSTTTFWAPESGWGMHFVVTVVVVEMLSGALFPLDILPDVMERIALLTPFPYLIYFPLKVYLGQASLLLFIKGLGISISWIMILWFLLKYVWNKGLKIYEAYGR